MSSLGRRGGRGTSQRDSSLRGELQVRCPCAPCVAALTVCRGLRRMPSTATARARGDEKTGEDPFLDWCVRGGRRGAGRNCILARRAAERDVVHRRGVRHLPGGLPLLLCIFC